MQLLTTVFFIFLLLTASLSLAAPHPDANSTHPHSHPDTNATKPHYDIHHHHNNTSQLDKLCQEIALLENLVHELNATTVNATEADVREPADISKQPHHPHLNPTPLLALLSNATAKLQNLTANVTLAGLCKTARQVEHDCLPLVSLIWANMTDKDGSKGWEKDDGRGHGRGNGTEIGMRMNATAVGEAEKNATLVAICEAWVTGMTKDNLSETDAALTAVENVTSTSTSDSTSSSSSSSSASASTGTGSSSGAVQSATLSGGLAACAVIILVGMMIVS